MTSAETLEMEQMVEKLIVTPEHEAALDFAIMKFRGYRATGLRSARMAAYREADALALTVGTSTYNAVRIVAYIA